ncbi:hypothetical protein U9M48_003920, partial [Paspalum notatum var. saurae]
AELKSRLLPRASCRLFQNLEVNWVPLSDTILLGTPFVRSAVGGLDRYEMGSLSESIHNDPYCIIALLGL